MPGDEIPTLRRAAPADVRGITACVQAAYAPYTARLGMQAGPLREDYARTVAEKRVWVAACRGSIAGGFVLGESPWGLLLENIAVTPAWQGAGLGRRLLALAESEARGGGWRWIHLYTNASMTENQALYRHLGYRVYDRGVEDGYDRVYMRKPLGRESDGT